MKKHLFALLTLAAVLVGCASFPTTVYNTEKTATDTAYAGVHSFNLYYQAATNGASPQQLAALNTERDQVYDASRKFSAAVSVLDQARLSYTQNAADTNKAQVQILTDAVLSQSANIVTLIKTFTAK